MRHQRATSSVRLRRSLDVSRTFILLHRRCRKLIRIIAPDNKPANTQQRSSRSADLTVQLSVVVRREHLSQSLEVMVRVQIVASTGHTTQLQCDCDEPPNHASISIARRQSEGSEPLRATKIVVATSRPSQHSRGGCYSGGYTRGSRRHSS